MGKTYHARGSFTTDAPVVSVEMQWHYGGMMKKASSRNITRTAIISAFTIATALIWKDVISDVLHRFIGPDDQLLVQLGIAVAATIISIIAIRVFLQAEEEAEIAIKRFADYIEPHNHEGRKNNHRR